MLRLIQDDRALTGPVVWMQVHLKVRIKCKFLCKFELLVLLHVKLSCFLHDLPVLGFLRRTFVLIAVDHSKDA